MGHHGLLIRNSSAPIGMLAAKLRQLSIIGYTPIVVSFVEIDISIYTNNNMKMQSTIFVIFCKY